MKNLDILNIEKGSRKTKALLLVFLLPILFLISSCESNDIIQKNNIKIKGELAYDRVASLYGGNPLRFEISNEGRSDFDGEIKVKIPLNEGNHYEIEIPVELAAGSKKTINQSVELQSLRKEIEYDLCVDGDVINTGRIAVDRFLKPDTPKLAIISDNPDNYSFFADMRFNKEEVIFKRISYESSEQAVEVGNADKNEIFIVNFENFDTLDTLSSLQFFDYIFIGDVSNLSMNEKTSENLLSWVSQGGVLITEVGKNFDKMNKQIPDELKQVDFDKVENIEHIVEPFAGKVEQASGKIIRKNTKKMILNTKLVGYQEHLGSGQLITINTLLNDGVVANWNIKASYLNYFFDRFYVSSSVFTEDSNGRNPTYRFNYMLENVPLNAELPYDLIMWILLVYVFVAGPVLYIILKKKDKQSLMWILAPVISIVVIVGISQISSYVWGGKPILNEISMIYYKESDSILSINSKMALFNNEKSNMKITWQEDENTSINLDYNDYTGPYYGRGETSKSIGTMKLGQISEYNSYDTSLWSHIKANARKTIRIPENNTSAVFKDESTLILNNGLPFEFEEAVIYRNDRYYYLGKIENSKEYEFKLDELESDQNPWGLLSLRNADENDPKSAFRNLLSETGLPRMDYDNLFLIAYTEKPVDYSIEINDSKPNVFARNLVFVDINLDIPKGSKVSLGMNEIEYKVYAYDPKTYYSDKEGYEHLRELSLHDNGMSEVADSLELRCDYILPMYVDYDSIEIDFNSNSRSNYDFMRARGAYSAEDQDTGEKYLVYNFLTNEYEEIIPEIVAVEDKEKEQMIRDLGEKEYKIYESFMSSRLYKIDLTKHISKEGLIKTKTIKPSIFTDEYYEYRYQTIRAKGVYND